MRSCSRSDGTSLSQSHVKVIVNPAAGGGSIRRQWPQIHDQLIDLGLSFEYEFTKSPGHATDIAKREADTGCTYLIAVGGDGTINEVANGILSAANPKSTVLGIVCAGTACSIARSLGITQDTTGACSILVGQGRISIDVGIVECQNKGSKIKRFFINEASVGFGAEVMDITKELPNRFGHYLNVMMRTAAAYGNLITHRNKWVTLRTNGEVEKIPACYVVVANGQYFADGMKVAPHARLDDGLLDLMVIGDVSKAELLKIVPLAYSGGHIDHPKIRNKKASVITLESNEQLLVEADGEIFGECPATFSVMPSALTVVV